jgi:enolase-phosphatase E1
MDRDSKTTGLKALQGVVWESGFRSGALQAEVFADMVDALKRWRQAGVDLRIYSSGSILAQQLFFGHSTEGDLTSLFSKHYDTTSGSKKEAESYLTIAKDIGLPPEQIVFFTDVYAEIQAASQAGMQVVACLRPNNVPLPSDYAGLMIESFDSIEWN